MARIREVKTLPARSAAEPGNAGTAQGGHAPARAKRERFAEVRALRTPGIPRARSGQDEKRRVRGSGKRSAPDNRTRSAKCHGLYAARRHFFNTAAFCGSRKFLRAGARAGSQVARSIAGRSEERRVGKERR